MMSGRIVNGASWIWQFSGKIIPTYVTNVAMRDSALPKIAWKRSKINGNFPSKAVS